MRESAPAFAAGHGAFPTKNGAVELGAALMDGSTLDVGAVACVIGVPQPMRLARLILESPQVVLAGEGARLCAEQHGHPGGIAVSPDGRWTAVGGRDNQVRLFEMPDLSRPPLHTLPRDELIAKLETLTNIRVIRDDESSTAWKVEAGPFPGWETAPTC